MGRFIRAKLRRAAVPALGLFAILSAGIGAPADAADAPRSADAVRAQLTARHYALVAAEVGAKVSQVHFTDGQAFSAGDLLISFESSLQRAQVERAEAVLQACERTAAANQRLLALKSIGQVEAELSESEVAKARAELSYARAMLSKCEIHAPFGGRVSEQKVHDQEFVQPGQPLIEIIDSAVPQVEFIAPSKWLAWLRAGAELRLSIDETGRTYLVRVERIGAKVDAVSQSIRVAAGFADAAPELMAGMSGTIAAPVPTS